MHTSKQSEPESLDEFKNIYNTVFETINNLNYSSDEDYIYFWQDKHAAKVLQTTSNVDGN